ncbi:hypothetical protein BU26DRAFT_143162 [Trematosphaeria pertusa]|uniref:Uncharacterized protein n=1 Tax=Trematosphaeria pertusa TaxID=390896 RepID=A0A6A6IVT1_9PLEO|nr:uncharacterized protein BU26DRAFT_143162 [Trematosphaeria pertusa]KAF2254661.1 hypothetical protein BU26DRAFT_143162 [Trematosphaeria pertusa]
MCWCFPFGLSHNTKRKSSSSGQKKRRERPAADALHGDGKPVVAAVQEKHRSKEAPKKRRSRETVTPRSPRREREEHRSRQQDQYQYQYHDAYRSREQYRPALNVQVPNMWHRSVDPESVNSSEEMLLNPRPHRSPHHRQHHPKRTSQTTLRGRGAKRDRTPPKHSKPKKNLRYESSGGWSFFAPSPPKTPKTQSRRYQTLDSSPRSHRSSRQHRSTHQYQEIPEATSRSQRHHRSRQTERQPTSTRQARSRTPNTAARRDPDRRFAVLAATNQALEQLRQEAFAQPSPPPRREPRLRRYQGVTVAASSIPWDWDGISSSQTSAGYGESSARHRRSRR